jgi:predicted Zn-dependent peptidase
MRERINVTRFQHGITLYSMAHSMLNISAVGFRSGSIHDPPGQSGINHLVEHLVCRRSVNYTERDAVRIMNRYMGGTHGSDINVRCDRSSVLYGHGDLRKRDYMWKCFDLYANMVKDVIFDAYGIGPKILDQKGLKVEKAAVHNEYRHRGTDVAGDHLYDLVHWNLYKRNPARRRIDCSRGDLSNIKMEQVKKFIRDRYTTDNMFVILIGPKNHEAVEKVREYFGDIPRRKSELPGYDSSDNFPILDGIKSFEIVRPGIRQHHVAIAFPVGNYLSNDVEALDVLTAIWESRIEDRLREENLDFNKGIYHPETFFPRTFAHGMVMGFFPTIGDKDYTERAISIAVEEWEKLKSDNSMELIEDCEDRKGFLADAYDQMPSSNPLYLCEAIAEATCNGDINLKKFLSYRQRLSRVTPKRLREVAEKYITTPDRYIRVVIKPLTVPQEIIDRAPDEAKSYLEAINYDPDFGGI